MCEDPVPAVTVRYPTCRSHSARPPTTNTSRRRLPLTFCSTTVLLRYPAYFFLFFVFHSLVNCEMYKSNICNIFWTTLDRLHKINMKQIPSSIIIKPFKVLYLLRINKGGSQNLHIIIFSYSHNFYNLWTVYNIDFGFVIIHNFILRAYIITIYST